jgi:hypothetical protein
MPHGERHGGMEQDEADLAVFARLSAEVQLGYEDAAADEWAPGSVIGLNRAAELEPLQFQHGGVTGIDTDVEALVNLIATGTGMPRDYLWQSVKGGARANALVATEPGAKRFEKRQRVVERLLHRMAERVFDAAGVGPDDREGEFIFPSIATEDRSAKLKDLAFAESSTWISKETAATTAAKELDFTTYEYDAEQKLVAQEWDAAQDEEDPDPDAEPEVDPLTGQPKVDPLTGEPVPPKPKPAQGGGKIRRPMISAQYRQAPKLDPTRAPGSVEDDPGGTLVPLDGSDPAAVAAAAKGQPGAGVGPESKQTRAGFPTDENPSSPAGAANIRADNARESVTMSAEAFGEFIREAMRRTPRRRPDDPDFAKRAAEFRDQSRANLDQLVDDTKTTGEES